MRWLERFLKKQLERTEEGQRLSRLRPLVWAIDTFFFEVKRTTDGPPHIRDTVDMKRWMFLVVIALLPCTFMAIWNTGVQSFVYTSGDAALMRAYSVASHSFREYAHFVLIKGRWVEIIKAGLKAFLPVLMLSYIVGGVCEIVFAIVRKREIAEGFLVSGLLFALILPSTIPYWMVAVGVAGGVILSKELFGGTGRNIMNPALCCRVLLFFAFPSQMTGDVWVGTNPKVVRESLVASQGIDGVTQATPLARLNVGLHISRVHMDAIAANFSGVGSVATEKSIKPLWQQWAAHHSISDLFGSLPSHTTREFVVGKREKGGLGLSPESFVSAKKLAELRYSQGMLTDWNFFLGNRPGAFGETSILASCLGALFLIWTGVGSWRIMIGVLGGAFGTASLFQLSSSWFGADGGAWLPAVFSFPAYKHLLLGSVVFGAVFMATDPVSSPVLRVSRFLYGGFIGMMTIMIRVMNPAYPEGVMLAILLGNIVAPLIDHHIARIRRRYRVFL